MRKIILGVLLSAAIAGAPLLAQEKNGMPMKGQMPMKEGMQGSGMDMNKMKDMHARMTEMRRGIGGMTKEQGMMKSEDMKGMGGMMADMSGMMGNMGEMTRSGKMTPEETSEMSKLMSDMSGMMKQMSERMSQRTKQTK